MLRLTVSHPVSVVSHALVVGLCRHAQVAHHGRLLVRPSDTEQKIFLGYLQIFLGILCNIVVQYVL